MDGRYRNARSRSALKIVAAVLLVPCLGGCATQVLEVRKPAPLEEPINSLALEQCVRENGQEGCQDQGM